MNTKHIALCAAASFAISGLSVTAEATAAQTAAPAPTYRVTADYFKAIDESGHDKTGSDEPYFIFSALGSGGTKTATKTREFGDVDSGDMRRFPGKYSCIMPLNCSATTAPEGIGASVQIWEADKGDLSKRLAMTAEYLERAETYADYVPNGSSQAVSDAAKWAAKATSKISEWYKDDLVGSRTFTVPKSDLDRHLTYAGDYFRFSKFFGDRNDSGFGTPGYYELRIKVTRVS